MSILGAVAGAVIGGVFSGVSQSQSNSYARSQAKKTNKYNNEMYEYNWEQTLSNYDYNKKQLENAKINNENNLLYQEASSLQSWGYGMRIRDFEFNTQNRAYERSVLEANKQLSFNEAAFDVSLNNEQRWFNEQMLSLNFDERQLMVDFYDAQRGANLSQRKIDQQSNEQRQQSAFDSTATAVEGLKAEGRARARGQAGRSAEGEIQSVLAEQGMRQAQIAQAVLNASRNYNISSAEIANSLRLLNDQLLLDKQQILADRKSLTDQSMANRQELQLQKRQADMTAVSRILNKPELAPDLPVPYQLPRPVYTDIPEPVKPPKPVKSVPYTPDPWMAGFSTALPSLTTAAVNAVGTGKGQGNT